MTQAKQSHHRTEAIYSQVPALLRMQSPVMRRWRRGVPSGDGVWRLPRLGRWTMR